MRPEILFSMFEHVTRLPGVGPHVGALIEKVAGPNIIDLYAIFCWANRFGPFIAPSVAISV